MNLAISMTPRLLTSRCAWNLLQCRGMWRFQNEPKLPSCQWVEERSDSFMLVRVSAPFELGQSTAPVHKSNSLSKLNQLPSAETVEKLLERCNEKSGCCEDICQPVPIAVKARRLIRLSVQWRCGHFGHFLTWALAKLQRQCAAPQPWSGRPPCGTWCEQTEETPLPKPAKRIHKSWFWTHEKAWWHILTRSLLKWNWTTHKHCKMLIR